MKKCIDKDILSQYLTDISTILLNYNTISGSITS